MKPRYESAESANSLATPAVIKDCADKVANKLPGSRVIGNFAFSPVAATTLNSNEYLLRKENLVALVAPAMNKGLFGEVRVTVGCSYFVENGKLAFQDVHGAGSFTIRTYVHVPVR